MIVEAFAYLHQAFNTRLWLAQRRTVDKPFSSCCCALNKQSESPGTYCLHGHAEFCFPCSMICLLCIQTVSSVDIEVCNSQLLGAFGRLECEVKPYLPFPGCVWILEAAQLL